MCGEDSTSSFNNSVDADNIKKQNKTTYWAKMSDSYKIERCKNTVNRINMWTIYSSFNMSSRGVALHIIFSFEYCDSEARCYFDTFDKDYPVIVFSDMPVELLKPVILESRITCVEHNTLFYEFEVGIEEK